MTSNHFFQSGRFFKLLSYDLLIHHKRYLSVLASATIILLFMLVISMTSHEMHFGMRNYQGSLFLCLIAGGLFVSSSFPYLNSEKGTCHYLLLPASAFEKFLVEFVIRFVFFIPVALCLYWITTNLARLIAQPICLMQGYDSIIDSFTYKPLFKDATDPSSLFIGLGIFSLGTFMFSARLFFKRFAVMKSLLSGVTVLMLCLTCLVILSHIFIPETIGFDITLKDIPLRNGLTTITLFRDIIAGVSWLFCLPIGYFKLKELQG